MFHRPPRQRRNGKGLSISCPLLCFKGVIVSCFCDEEIVRYESWMKEEESMRITKMIDAFFLLHLLAFPLSTLANDGAGLFRASSTDSRFNLFFDPRDAYVLGPEEQQRYGAMHSPNLHLMARQQNKCPFPVRCSGNTCCPAGTQCVSLPELESRYEHPSDIPFHPLFRSGSDPCSSPCHPF